MNKAILPHQGSMRLVDELLDYDDQHAHARTRIAPDHAFRDAEGAVPAWLGLEMMAQAVAAWAGARGREKGEGVRMGYLLGARSFDAEVPVFAAGSLLDIHVQEVLRQDNGFGSYTGEIRLQGEVIARGRLSVMETDTIGDSIDGENA